MKGLSRARLSGLFIFFAVTITLKSQSFSEHNISVYPETYKPPVFDKKKSFEAFLQKHDRYFKLDIRKEEYAHLVTETLSELNNSFTIYEDLPEETAYLNKVLRATIPDSLIKENVKVRIIRDPSVNAFSIEDGSINLNAGFFKYCKQ